MVDFFSQPLLAGQGYSLALDAASLIKSLLTNPIMYNPIRGPNSNSFAFTLLWDSGVSVSSISVNRFGFGTLVFNGQTQYFTGWAQYLDH